MLEFLQRNIFKLVIPSALFAWVLWRFLRRFRRAPFPLAGRVVLVTGAAAEGGLGISLAGEARRRGAAKVIVTGRRQETLEPAKEMLLRVEGQGEVDAALLDLDWPADKLTSAVGEIWSRAGHIDVLINNAGGSYRGYLLETQSDVHAKLMQANYFGHVHVTTEIVKRMKSSGVSGFVVAISSIQGRLSIPYRSAYSASKHAFQAFFDCLRAEVASLGIRVLVVSPSYMRTNLSRNAVRDTGSAHGQLDATTAHGITPERAASRVCDAVEDGAKELLLSGLGHRLGVLMRSLAPGLFFWNMERRARQSKPY